MVGCLARVVLVYEARPSAVSVEQCGAHAFEMSSPEVGEEGRQGWSCANVPAVSGQRGEQYAEGTEGYLRSPS